MRAFLVAVVFALASSACYTSAPEPVYAHRVGDRWSQPVEAYMTDGHAVTVQEDARTGDLVITDPYELRGHIVAMVNNDPTRPIVKLLDAEEVARYRHHRPLGSGGDVW